MLAWSKKVFGSTLTNAVIRHTFYKQAGFYGFDWPGFDLVSG